MAKIRCPMCGEPNPDDLEFCQWCDARLKPLSAPSPDDLPIKGNSEGIAPLQSGEPDQSIPDWLQVLRKDAEPAPGGAVDENLQIPYEGENLAASQAGDDSTPASSEGAKPAPDSEVDDQVPDWLVELRGTATAPVSQPDESISSASVPPLADVDWLARLDGAAHQPPTASGSASGDGLPDKPESIEPTPGQPKPDESLPGNAGGELLHDQPPGVDLPDWLESLKNKASESEGRLTGEEELPDWLAAMPVIPPDGSPPGSRPEPDWMNELKERSEEAGSPNLPPVPPTKSSDSSISEEKASGVDSDQQAHSVFTDEPSKDEAVNEEIPGWLYEIKPGWEEKAEEGLAAKTVAPFVGIPDVGKSGEFQPASLPELAKKEVSTDSVPTQVEPGNSVFSDKESPDTNALETPEWISKLAIESSEEIEPPDVEGETDNIKATELPSWVQAMRPMESVISEAGSSIENATGDAESSGPLAGLRGVLPTGTGIEIDRKPPLYSNKLQVTDGQLKYAAQLEKMVTEEGQPKKPRHVHLSSDRLMRWVISVLLISAILLPLVVGKQITPDLKLFPSEWSATKALLDTLPDHAPVLLVSDFEPALYGELQVSATPLIERMLAKGSQFTLISTSPTGPALARQILDSILVDQTLPEAQVTNLGYLPGGSAGIYYFASSPQEAVPYTVDGSLAWETLALQGVGRFDNFALLLLLTDNADTGRAWIEQTRSFIGDTPILMVISAQAEPMLRPYYASGQIQGLVTGLAGGKIYEQSFEQNGLARDYWDSFGTGTLTAACMMAIGGVVASGMALSSRKKGEKA